MEIYKLKNRVDRLEKDNIKNKNRNKKEDKELENRVEEFKRRV